MLFILFGPLLVYSQIPPDAPVLPVAVSATPASTESVNIVSRTDCEEPQRQICPAESTDARRPAFIENLASEQVRRAAEEAASAMNEQEGMYGLLRSQLEANHIPTAILTSEQKENVSERMIRTYISVETPYESNNNPLSWTLAPEMLNRCTAVGDTAEDRAMQELFNQLTQSMEPFEIYGDVISNFCQHMPSARRPVICRDRETNFNMRRQILRLAMHQNDPELHQRESNALKRQLLDLYGVLFVNNRPQTNPAAQEGLDFSGDAMNLGVNRCAILRNLYADRYYEAQSAFLTRFTRSAPFVRAVERRFFSQENINAIQEVLREVRQDLRNIFLNEISPRAGLSESDRNRVLAEWDAFGDLSPGLVAENLFTQTPDFPAPYLQLNFSQQIQLQQTRPTSPFFSTGLSGFMTVNGNYEVQRSYGVLRTPENFQLTPAQYIVAPEHPVMLRQLIGHELSHKFGPDMSAVNGVSLGAAYTSLNACFAREFAMASNQFDESVADWLSARAFGLYLRRIATDEVRIAATRDFISYFCTDAERYNGSLRLFHNGTRAGRPARDVHPDAFFRVNFILGHHPEVQRLLGCSPPARYCDFSGGAP